MYGVGIYDIFGREITKYTVIYGVYIRFWPTLIIVLERARLVNRVSKVRTPRYMLVSLLFLLHHCWLVYVQNAHSTLHAGFTSVSVAPLLVGLCSKCALHVTCWFHFCFFCTTVGWFMLCRTFPASYKQLWMTRKL